jgi:hypothetical protein
MKMHAPRLSKPGFAAHPASLLSPRDHRAVNPQQVLRTQARIPTTRGERYAKQLCRHAARLASRADWTPPEGVIEFPNDIGTCRMTAEPDHMLVTIEATDAASLTRLQQIIGSNIERFSSRDGLTVEWVQL